MAAQASDFQLKEYELLRTELLQHDRAVLQTISIFMGFVGVITAQGIVSGNPYVFLIPLPIVLVLYMYIADKRLTIWLMASYLREFVEKQRLGPLWETRLSLHREITKKKRPKRKDHFLPAQNIIEVEYAFSFMITLVEVTLFSIYGLRQSMEWYWIFLVFVVWVILVGIIFMFHKKLIQAGQLDSDLHKVWGDMKT